VSDSLGPGAVVGPYRLGEVIGRGGTGTVYRAARIEPEFVQSAAVKVLHEPSTPARRAAFAREQECLRRFEHPGIPQLRRAADPGEPVQWFAMELVDGIPIDRYCNEGALGVDQRVELLQQVCRAVDYAHQRGVAHLDLKPSNILVTRGGRVRVVDFGFARQFEPAASVPVEGSDGTPLAYVSPEQLAPGAAVGMASDTYSLGVVLYQLLAGRLPHDVESMSSQRASRVIREELPPPPSRAVKTVARAKAPGGVDITLAPDRVAAQRDTTPSILSRQLAGNLDYVALKALAKDPERRYPSLSDLDADLERHRSGAQLDPGHDSLVRQGLDFVRRRPLAAAVGAALLCAVQAMFLAPAILSPVIAEWTMVEANAVAASRELRRALILDVPARVPPSPEAERLQSLVEQATGLVRLSKREESKP
jgi:eukaryotic-like serine/threonine-protein kinase